MTGDHHGQTASRATLQVTAADEILGTHTRERHGRAATVVQFAETQEASRPGTTAPCPASRWVMREITENAHTAADLHPDVLDVDQDRDGADLVVLRAFSAGIARLRRGRSGRAPG
jgi:hypothetical protein